MSYISVIPMLYILLLFHCYCKLHNFPIPGPTFVSHELTYCINYLFPYRTKQLVNIFLYVYRYQSTYQDINRNFLHDICIVSTCVITTSYLHLPYHDYPLRKSHMPPTCEPRVFYMGTHVFHIKAHIFHLFSQNVINCPL